MSQPATCLAIVNRGSIRVIAAISSALMLGGCAQVGEEAGLLDELGAGRTAASPAPQEPRQAADYWSKQYMKNPRSLDTAIAYARALKALGEKQQALAVLQQAATFNSTDRALASEYGRLALELDQVSVAKKLLEVADDPANPDWRVVMARGTALAKEGHYKEATGYFERAQSLQPDHPSVLSNLALAYTMSGEPQKGETLLRRAAAGSDVNAKVRQNLAIVLGLQGKYDEATHVGSMDIPAESARENADILRKIVKLDAAKGQSPILPTGAWETQVAEAPGAMAMTAAPSSALVTKVSATNSTPLKPAAN
ncbi:MAG: tetratricopeptide repeat protein [Hyphomicrobium sp.]